MKLLAYASLLLAVIVCAIGWQRSGNPWCGAIAGFVVGFGLGVGKGEK